MTVFNGQILANPNPKFVELDPSTRPYLTIAQETIDKLESITAAEKAQAVPYMKLWRIKPETGEPFNGKNGFPTSPLSMQLVKPPSFGTESDARFRERPAVSFGKATIKTNAPKGDIINRQITISFVVHKPEVIFSTPEDGVDNWSDLLIPGNVFAMEYGWTASSGVKNGLINGEGFLSTHYDPVPAINRIRFVVTHYDFSLSSDNQVSVSIQAAEDGQLNVMQAFVIPTASSVSNGKLKTADPKDAYSKEAQKNIKSLEKIIKEKIFDSDNVKPGSKGYDDLIEFKTVCDVLFAPIISKAYTSLGYNTPSLFLGAFNKKAGSLVGKYGGKPMSDKSIGDFTIPRREVAATFAKLRDNTQITLGNFIREFTAKIMNPEVWQRSKGADEIGAVVRVRIVTNKKQVAVYIIDLNRELTRFFSTDKKDFAKQLAGAKPTRAKIRDELRKKGVPMVTLGHSHSYVQDASFNVMNNDPVKTLLMKRALDEPARVDKTQKTELEQKTKEANPKLLYSSAIQGEITMLGNFAFDTFGLIWLDFGIPVWSGPFFITGRVDNIDRSGFTTTISVYSSGEDPLGTRDT